MRFLGTPNTANDRSFPSSELWEQTLGSNSPGLGFLVSDTGVFLISDTGTYLTASFPNQTNLASNTGLLFVDAAGNAIISS